MPPGSTAHVKYNKYINNLKEEIGSIRTVVLFMQLYLKDWQLDCWKLLVISILSGIKLGIEKFHQKYVF